MEVCPGSLSNKQDSYPSTLFIPNSHTLLTSISNRSKFFTIIDVCSAHSNQYLFAFIWKTKQCIHTVMPWGCTESLYFSEILKADLGDIKFPKGSNLLHTWMICFFALFLKAPHSKTASSLLKHSALKE